MYWDGSMISLQPNGGDGTEVCQPFASKLGLPALSGSDDPFGDGDGDRDMVKLEVTIKVVAKRELSWVPVK